MIDSLPDELLEIILSHVNYVDLLCNCKLVSKRWLQIVNALRFDELIVTGCFLYESYWYHSFRAVNMKNVLQFDRSNFWEHASFRNHFGRLKFLKYFSYFGHSERFFEHLSEFELLEHLEFGGLESPKKDHQLRLPRLRTLKIRTSPSYSDHQLIIDADRLQVLHCYRLNFIRLLSRSSIKTLEVYLWKSFFRDNPDFQSYENLETLKVIDLQNSFNLSEIELSLPASLKQIHVNSDCMKDDDLADDELMDVEPESDVQDCYRESFKIWKRIIKLAFKQNAPEFYFLNVRVDLDKANTAKFDDYDFRPKELDFYRRNYSVLAETFPFFSRIDYDQLMSLWGRRLPADLFRRFNNIQKLAAKRIENPQHLLWFLGHCPLLTELDLHCPKFSQNAYDQLPTLCGRLTHFYLAERITQLISYEFVRNFAALSLFSTSQNLSRRLALDIVKRLKFLQDFIFNDQRGTVTISKINRQFAFAYKKYEFDRGEWRSRPIIDYTGLSFEELEQLCSSYQLIQSL